MISSDLTGKQRDKHIKQCFITADTTEPLFYKEEAKKNPLYYLNFLHHPVLFPYSG